MKKRNNTVFAELNLIHKNTIEKVCMQKCWIKLFFILNSYKFSLDMIKHKSRDCMLTLLGASSV